MKYAKNGDSLYSQEVLQNCSIKNHTKNHRQGPVSKPHFNEVTDLLTLNFPCIKKYQNNKFQPRWEIVIRKVFNITDNGVTVTWIKVKDLSKIGEDQ